MELQCVAEDIRQVIEKEEYDRYDFNCGGYALRNFEWYIPLEWDEREELINNCFDEGYDYGEAVDTVLAREVNCILEDNPELMEINPEELNKYRHQDIIAYRIGFDYGNEDYGDFHFKLYHNGKWSEKLGASEIHSCKLELDNIWEYPSDLIYDSDIIFLVRKNGE